MSISDLLDTIKTMDVKSDEFFKLYCTVSDKFWGSADPNNREHTARKALVMIGEKADPWLVMISAFLADEAFKLIKDKLEAVNGSFNCDGKDYYFNMYSDPTALDRLAQVMRNNVIVEGKKQNKGDLN